MKVKVQYLGARAEKLGKYNLPSFIGGPYDFRSGVCVMEKDDADILIKDNPRGFAIKSVAKVKNPDTEAAKTDKDPADPNAGKGNEKPNPAPNPQKPAPEK